jgi:hypothetical protein
MAEATLDASRAEAAALEQAARELDRARMKQIGGYHFAMVVGALTLWGAAATWAQETGWAIAQLAAVANALVAGTVIPSVVHEWGHFLGARASGAASPVFEEPRRHFFLFDFPMDQNDTRQFTWMSWGGIVAPWLVVLLAAVFVPLHAAGAMVLLATLVARAVSVAGFEVPVTMHAARSGQPGAELGQALQAGGLDRSRKIGFAVGVACFALLWLAV